MLENIHWIALIPLLVAPLILFFGNWLPGKGSFVGIAAAGAGLAWSLLLFFQAAFGALPIPYESSMTWFQFGIYEAALGVLVDAPALVMLVVVTTVSFLVQLYSLGYMHYGEEHEDPRFTRYYAYLSFFTASMLGLVLANNLLLLFVCWELVGVSSYLLIGFWFEKKSAAYAGKKAFITTKLGDLGFFIGLLFLFKHCGTLNLVQLQEHILRGYLSPEAATLIALLIFCGAVGKSAQIPLFVWLPDAMEGPSPVSALIHAATMVAAGVYLVARLYFLYVMSPIAMDVVAWIGLLTALMAATMALVAYDIKRVLAFSTISQLGYMMLGLGVGGYTEGLFHLTTHAFFKALLFLGAGSVIHAMHSNDMRDMGGLSTKLPITFSTMLMATLAISGVPPFSGYFSKDAILAKVFEHSHLMWAIAVFTAGLTAFYMFRLVFMTFRGSPRNHEKYLHAKESPWSMTVPLIILAILSVVSGGILEYKSLFKSLVHFGAQGESTLAEHAAPHALLAVVSTIVALISIGLAYTLYIRRESLAERIKVSFQAPLRILDQRYGFDGFYLKLVDGADRLAAACYWFDLKIVDRIFVDGWGLVTLLLSEVQNFIDSVFVDGAVDSVGGVTVEVGKASRAAMRGQVQEYLLYVAIAASLFAALIHG